LFFGKRNPLLILILILVIGVAIAQEVITVYQDALFSTEIPAGWTEQTPGYYTHENGSELYLLSIPADDVQSGISAGLEIIRPGFDHESVDTRDLPAPNGIWTQNIYILDDGAISAALGQVKDGQVALLYIESPDQMALGAVSPDLNNVLLGITFIGGIDLAGVMPSSLNETQITELEAYIEGAMETFHVPGAAVAIVQNGEIIYSNGFGVRDLESSQAVDAETLFMIGSTTKSMTTLTLATLVDEGVIRWDTPVVDILPEFALSDVEVTRLIRVRDLVNNMSGVPRYDMPLFLRAFQPEDVFSALSTIPMTAQPGEIFGYSNQMVAAGGYIAALAAGATYGENVYETYVDLVQERVFDPLGMDDTTFDFDAALSDDNHALPTGYDLLNEELVSIPINVERFALSVAPAGAVWSNAGDMAKYLQMALGRGVAADGTRIVSEENLLETQTPGIQIAGKIYYAMGWMVEDYKGQPLIQHGGNTSGFTSDFAFLPDAGLGVLVLTNRSTSNNFSAAVREYVFELAFDLDPTAHDLYVQADEAFNAIIEQLITEHRTTEVDADTVADYAGIYEEGAVFEINEAGEFVLITAYVVIPLQAIEGQPGHFVSVDPAVGGLLINFEQSDGEISVTFSNPIDPSQTLMLKKVE
jgi:CubicO group peptidase (beta-lactamase class C family)